MRPPSFLSLLALLLCGCLSSTDDDCGPADFPATCHGYRVEYTVNGESRTDQMDVGVLLHDDALPERRYYFVGALLTKLSLTFPKSEVGRYGNQALGSRVEIQYDNSGTYESSAACGEATVEVSGLNDRALWGRFDGVVCGTGLGGAPASVKLNVSGRFGAKREDP
jgi:hypothetical protein